MEPTEERKGGFDREDKHAYLPDIVDPVEIGCDLGIYSWGSRPPTAMAPAHDAHHLPPVRVIQQRAPTVTLRETRAEAAGEGGQGCGGEVGFRMLPSCIGPSGPALQCLLLFHFHCPCSGCSCSLECPSLLGRKGSVCCGTSCGCAASPFLEIYNSH